MSAAEKKDDDKDKDIAPEVKRLKSSFERQDIALIVQGKKLYINRAELMEKSPVFKTMFTADFKEKNALEIELPDKDLHHFLMFLRCTLDGYDDLINGCTPLRSQQNTTDLNVRFIIPIAHEYQVKETLDKADVFLSNHYHKRTLDGCSSKDTVNGIIEAEKYGLTQTLSTLIGFASRKKFAYISQASDFNTISKKVLHKISMARWKNDIDGNTGNKCSTSNISYGVRS